MSVIDSSLALFLVKRLTLSSDVFNTHALNSVLPTEKDSYCIMRKVNQGSLKFSYHLVRKLAIKLYKDPLNMRESIREDNKGKAGVYCWLNRVNGKSYIGSGDPLYVRLSDYYQKWYYFTRGNLYITRALSKYGMSNFYLSILEYTTGQALIKCEQKWIDLIKPEYNINPKAGNTKDYKHTEKSVEKMRQAALGKTHSKEVKRLMSETRKGVNNPFYGKKHSKEAIASLSYAASSRTKQPKAGVEVKITDLHTNITTVYESIRKAASAIDSDIKTLSRREKSQREKGINTPFRSRYTIVFKRVL